MTLNQLLYFQTIAKYEHFRQASIELNLSQPSLSLSISSLEEELGLPLFERYGRNVRLTKYGEIFLDHVNTILQQCDFAKEHMKQLASNRGHIDIAYVFPLANHYVPNLVRRFLQTKGNENITFSFHQSHTSDMIEGLKSGKYDVIFGSYVEHEPDISFFPILHQELVVIVSNNHELAHCSSIDIDILEQYPIIGYDHGSGLGRKIEKFYHSKSLHPKIICESPDENSIAALVAEEFGIALVANVDCLKNHAIRILPLKGEDLYHTVYVAHRKNYYHIPSIEHFIQFIQATKNSIPS